MAESNKNQTAAERARLKEALGAQLTEHICASPNCPSPGERIVMKELFPVVTLAPRRRTVFYHKACGPKLSVCPPPNLRFVFRPRSEKSIVCRQTLPCV